MAIEKSLDQLEDDRQPALTVQPHAGVELRIEGEGGWIERADRVGAARVALGKAQHPTVIEDGLRGRPGVERDLFERKGREHGIDPAIKPRIAPNAN